MNRPRIAHELNDREIPGLSRGLTVTPRDILGVPISRIVSFIALALTIVGGGITIALFAPHITFVAGKIDSAIVAATWLLVGLEIVFWRAIELWQDDGGGPLLRRSGWARMTLLPIVVVVAWLTPPSEESLIALAATSTFLLLTRLFLLSQISQLLCRRMTSGSRGYLAGRIYNQFKADPPGQNDQLTIDRRSNDNPPIRAGRLALRLRIPTLVTLTTVLSVVVIYISVAAGIHTKEWGPRGPASNQVAQEAKEKEAKEKEAKGKEARRHPHPEEGNKGPGTGSSPNSVTNSKKVCKIREQTGIPREVIEEIYELYNGIHKLGPEATGCPGEIYEESTLDGILYWAYALDGEHTNPRSIAVVSPRFHKAITLWPAALNVHEMIEKEEDVGGTRDYPHYYAGGGDYYLFRTKNGLVIMIQDETGTAIEARPYLQMPSSATTALLSRIRESKTWQWPALLRQSKDKLIYELRPSEGASKQSRVTYNVHTGIAARTGVREPYSQDQQPIPAAEFQEWIPPISHREKQREIAQLPVEEPDPK